MLLPCSKLQNESQPVKLKRKKHYFWTIWKFFDKLNQNKTNLANQRLLTITLIAFCGFMRFIDVSRFRQSDFIFSSTYAKVCIEKSKTDIYKEGMWVYVPASSKICPLKQLKCYLPLSKNIWQFRGVHFQRPKERQKSSLRKRQLDK